MGKMSKVLKWVIVALFLLSVAGFIYSYNQLYEESAWLTKEELEQISIVSIMGMIFFGLGVERLLWPKNKSKENNN